MVHKRLVTPSVDPPSLLEILAFAGVPCVVCFFVAQRQLAKMP